MGERFQDLPGVPEPERREMAVVPRLLLDDAVELALRKYQEACPGLGDGAHQSLLTGQHGVLTKPESGLADEQKGLVPLARLTHQLHLAGKYSRHPRRRSALERDDFPLCEVPDAGRREDALLQFRRQAAVPAPLAQQFVQSSSVWHVAVVAHRHLAPFFSAATFTCQAADTSHLRAAIRSQGYASALLLLMLKRPVEPLR